MTRPPCCILAGGAARRMGGGDKARLVLRGRTLIAHLMDRLEGQAGPLALNANGDPARWDDLGLPVLPDPVPGRPGPLAGVLAGMEWAAGLGAPRVLTVAADTPFPPRDLAARLAAAGDGIVLAETDGRAQPTFGLWPVGLAGDLRAALEAGTRKVTDWTGRHDAVMAPFASGSFHNVNTPGDLERLETGP